MVEVMLGLPSGASLPALVMLFGLSAAAVVAGTARARSGEAIAERTGLGASRVGMMPGHVGIGASLVGMLLLAGATSPPPEVTTDGSAALADVVAPAVGDLFGGGMVLVPGAAWAAAT